MSPTKEIPWPKISECLLQLEAATDKVELFKLSCQFAADLVDCDVGVGVFDAATHLWLHGLGISDWAIQAYNSYYIHLNPFVASVPIASGPVHFSTDDIWDSEAVQDFCNPVGIRYGVGSVLRNEGLNLMVLHSQTTHSFGAEVDGALILNRHVNVLYKRLSAPVPASLNLTLVEFMDRYKFTRREAEVFDLLLSGYQAALIASRLFISPRTVEKHVASIYAKTETRNRRQLRNLVDRYKSQLQH